MSHVAFVDRRLLWGHSVNAIYRIETEKAGAVYMRISRSDYARDKRAVVIVDAMKFLAAIRNFQRQEPVFYGDEAAWRADYKFAGAVDGFSHGIENPVPLAEVDAHREEDGTVWVGFTNGMTRTLWLLANGAAAFPVTCSTSTAALLHETAGLKEFPVCTVEQLLGFMEWGYFLEHQLTFC